MEGNKFLIVANDRVSELKKAGTNISLTSFKDHGKEVEIGFTVKEEKKFTISTDGKMFFLENVEHRKPGGRPTYVLERDMVDYILVLANGGPIAGKLMIPGDEERKFVRDVVIPT